jgi:XPG N-terminal domain
MLVKHGSSEKRYKLAFQFLNPRLRAFLSKKSALVYKRCPSNMGIHGLTKLLGDECPDCIKEFELDGLTGRKVAIDASMAMYQFLIAVRSGSDGVAAQMLTNEAGDVTSHIQGMFNRTIRCVRSFVTQRRAV